MDQDPKDKEPKKIGTYDRDRSERTGISTGTIVGIIVVILIIAAIVYWVL